MNRIPTQEQLITYIENANNMTVQEKYDYIKSYEKTYNLWLNSLKKKLNNYKPLSNDLNIRRCISPAYNYSKYNLKGEIWKEFPLDNRYAVSNMGRIKFKGKIQKQKDEKTGYCTLADKNLSKEYIYNFVAYTFLGKIKGDGYHVHHITNDGYYNTTDNLVLLTQKEHSYVHGFEIGGYKCVKK